MATIINSIDQVIEKLNSIIAGETANQSPLAYFPALYKIVTEKVKQGINNGDFEDNARMEQLDIVFAKRYFDAYDAFKNNGVVTDSWRSCFMHEKSHCIILQHITAGINAHINLDLGIAAAEIMESRDIKLLHNDFKAINEILNNLAYVVRGRLGGISPLIGLLDKLNFKVDSLLVKWSMELARDGAWEFAIKLHKNGKPEIKERDQNIAQLGYGIFKAERFWYKSVLGLIRLTESANVRKNVKHILNKPS